MTILPTHTCFDDALEYLSEKVKDGHLTLILVHGIQVIRTQEDGSDANGELFAHAWLEEDNLCWDFGIVKETGDRIAYAVERQAYYAERLVQEYTRYTPWEAARENLRTLHYGPWKPEYAALCGRDRKITGKINATCKPDLKVTYHGAP